MEAGGIEPPQRQKRPNSNSVPESGDSPAKTETPRALSRSTAGPETSRENPVPPEKPDGVRSSGDRSKIGESDEARSTAT